MVLVWKTSRPRVQLSEEVFLWNLDISEYDPGSSAAPAAEEAEL